MTTKVDRPSADAQGEGEDQFQVTVVNGSSRFITMVCVWTGDFEAYGTFQGSRKTRSVLGYLHPGSQWAFSVDPDQVTLTLEGETPILGVDFRDTTGSTWRILTWSHRVYTLRSVRWWQRAPRFR